MFQKALSFFKCQRQLAILVLCGIIALPAASQALAPREVGQVFKSEPAYADFAGRFSKPLIRYYSAGNPLLWVLDGTRRQQLIERLEQAKAEGLEVDHYPVQDLVDLEAAVVNGDRPPEDLEAIYSAVFLFYAADLKVGRFSPREVDSALFAQEKDIDAVKTLKRLNSSKSVKRFFQEWAPRNPEYRRLLTVLKQYIVLANRGGWQTVPDQESLKPGMRSVAVAALRARLEATHDISIPTFTADFFDEPLKQAVIRFQQRHGLVADGVVGKRSFLQLNVPVEERIRQLVLNIERWRWLPDDLGDDHILVNIAGFELKRVEGGRTVERMKVVVGRDFRGTPAFSDKIRYLEFNPTWLVPYYIAVQDKLPLIQEDVNYLAENDFEVLDRKTEKPIDPLTIDWESLSRENFPYLLRQKPGTKNALGQVKFMFPNKHSIYLHDTPAKALFNQNVRTFSSGCIRLHRPFELAEQVLAKNKGWDRAKIDETLESLELTKVQLDTPLNVHLIYATAWAGDDGSVHFRDDIYQRDEILYASLFAPDMLLE